MEETQTNQPTIGTWEKLPTEATELKPKVEFDLNMTVEVVFIEDEPQEMTGEKGAYYIFNVEANQTPKVIMTSAWTLLRELKTLSPLKGKIVAITKKMDNGKQHFEAVEKQEVEK